ncbi:acyltransferase [Streptomyces sp. TS71-3]|nr:acyltransferase [Streptomyces sp. TS71-3]
MAQATVRPVKRTSHSETAAGGPAWRLDIQGLRALAVSLVILSHAGVRHFRGGYTGVDVFFVVSGFVITSMLVREISLAGRISIQKFYARRVLRLLPASTVVVAATLAGSYLFLSKIRFVDYALDALTSTLYSVNFRLALTGTDYLNESSPPSPFQHFWSLATEEQFYVVWPLLLLLSWRLARRRPRLLPLPLAVLCLASLAVCVAVTEKSPSWAYFGSHARLWELGAGSLLVFFADRIGRLPGGLRAALSWTGLGGILLAGLTFDNATPFPGYHALLPVLGTLLVLAGGCRSTRFGAELLLGRRPVTWVGGVSYSWYLWHWPLLVVMPAALDRPLTARFGLALCAVALLLAWLTLRFVENPMRYHTAFKRRPRRALALGLTLTTGGVVVALVAADFPPSISSGKSAPVLSAELADAEDPVARLGEFLAAPATAVPKNLTPALTEVKATESEIYRDGCHVDYQSTQVRPCVYGDPSAKRTVVLFGDSHAAQWFPGLNLLARERHWRLVSLTKASCKVADVTITVQGKPYSSCDTWRDKALDRIAEMHPSLVIASSSDAGDPSHPSGDLAAQWTDGFAHTFRRLNAGADRVVALLDTPWPHGDAVDCAGEHPLGLDACASDVRRAVKDPRKATEIRAAARRTGVSVIDPVPWLCAPGGNCPAVVGNTLVYRDDSHMSEAYSEALAPVLDKALASAGR